MKFHLTVHVRLRMLERNLSLDELKDVVKYPQERRKQYVGDHGGTVFRFAKKRGQVKVTVVAEIKGQNCWLITGWK